MKVAISLEITNAQRNALSRLIHPGAGKRLATRDEVREFVAGALAALSPLVYTSPVTGSHVSPVGSEAQVTTLRAALEAKGFTPGYVRGFLSVCERYGSVRFRDDQKAEWPELAALEGPLSDDGSYRP